MSVPDYLLQFLQRHGATLIAFLMTGVVAAAVYFLFRLVRLARLKKYYLIKIEDGAIAPSSISAYVALLAAVVGGLWLAFSVGVSGSLELQRLSLELARTRHLPIMDIELCAQIFQSSAFGEVAKRAVHLAATVKNRGPKSANISLDILPLLNLTRIDAKVDNVISSLPYRKIECKSEPPNECKLSTWKKALLEPDGTAYYNFLHPGLEPGVYFAQFQLPVEAGEIRSGIFDPSKPVLWARSIYFEVKQPVSATSSSAAEHRSEPACAKSG